MKQPSKAGISELSAKPADKLAACLAHGTNVGSAAYLERPDCFNACIRWHSELTTAEEETPAFRIAGARDL